MTVESDLMGVLVSVTQYNRALIITQDGISFRTDVISM